MKEKFIVNRIKSKLKSDEHIITKLKTSNIIFYSVVILFAFAILLFPKTILEFFIKHNNIYFIGILLSFDFLFVGIYLSIYFLSRQIYLTNKRIIGKWGLFKVKKIDIPLNKLQSVDIFPLKQIEISTSDSDISYKFDFVANGENFRCETINQVKILIDSAKDEKALKSFSHSLADKLDEHLLSYDHPNMMYCKCCGNIISKESTFCVHCGQPLPENEKEADWLLKIFCFLLTPLGVLLFLFNIVDHRKLAHQCLISSILGIFLAVIIYLSKLSIITLI